MRSTCTFAVVTLLAATAASAQPPGAPASATTSATAFEVASVKPSLPPDPNNPLGMVPLPLTLPGGRFTATNTPLRMLIMMAYELREEAQLAGGPPALLAARYDINAKIAGATIGQKDLPPLLWRCWPTGSS